MPKLITIQIIESQRNVGKGTSEPDDPIRNLQEFHNIHGDLIGSYDPSTNKVQFNPSGIELGQTKTV